MSISCGSSGREFRLGRNPPSITVISGNGPSTFVKIPKGTDGFSVALELFSDIGILGKGRTEMYTELTDEDYKKLLASNPLLIEQVASGGIMGALTRMVPSLEFKAPSKEEMNWDVDMSILEHNNVNITLTGEGYDSVLIAVEEGKVSEAKELLLKLVEKSSIVVKSSVVTGVVFIPTKFLSKST